LTEQSQSLEEQAISDPLTGLRSRRYFLQRCEQDIAYALRHGVDLSLIHIDVDGFKKIYQAHGDERADRLLVWLSKLFFTTARTEDTVARLSGTEFAILANGTSIADAARLCERIREAVTRQPFSQGGVTIPLTLSMGLASLVQDRRETAESLLALAKQRLGHARSEGGDRVCASVLGEKIPEVEEIVLSPMQAEADLQTRQETLVHAEPETVRPDATIESTSLIPAHPEVPHAPVAIPPELFSVDRALQLLAQGRVEQLVPHLGVLRDQLQPLIDFCAVAGNLHTVSPPGNFAVEFEKQNSVAHHVTRGRTEN